MSLGSKIEPLLGATNGLNVIFNTQKPYIPGTTQLFWNGVLKVAAFTDGWLEIGGTVIKTKETPKVGDVLEMAYTSFFF